MASDGDPPAAAGGRSSSDHAGEAASVDPASCSIPATARVEGRVVVFAPSDVAAAPGPAPSGARAAAGGSPPSPTRATGPSPTRAQPASPAPPPTAATGKLSAPEVGGSSTSPPLPTPTMAPPPPPRAPSPSTTPPPASPRSRSPSGSGGVRLSPSHVCLVSPFATRFGGGGHRVLRCELVAS